MGFKKGVGGGEGFSWGLLYNMNIHDRLRKRITISLRKRNARRGSITKRKRDSLEDDFDALMAKWAGI